VRPEGLCQSKIIATYFGLNIPQDFSIFGYDAVRTDKYVGHFQSPAHWACAVSRMIQSF